MLGAFNFYDGGRPYNCTYSCYSVSMLPGNELRQDVDNGGKIILPPSALDQLTRLAITFPMLFKVSSFATQRETHCGVLEFVADEGKCYIPYWMMRNLMIEEGATVRIETATLPVATYSKFEPQSVEFLDITNPKAMLENALRSFACLTTGDMIAIKYNEKSYELRVLETKPGPAVSIVECDMDVEFSPPVDYVEPKRPEPEQEETSNQNGVAYDDPNAFTPFVGRGNRLDGKDAGSPTPGYPGGFRRGVPDTEWQFGTLTFFRPAQNHVTNKENGKTPKTFQPFSGSGSLLRQDKR